MVDEDGATGRLLVVHGPSGSGKSTLARGLQDTLPDPWLVFGIDDWYHAVPEAWAGGGPGPHAAIGFRYADDLVAGTSAIEEGPYGTAVLHAMHEAVVAMVRSGVDVILDGVHPSHAAVADLATRIASLERVRVVVVTADDETLRGAAARTGAHVGLGVGQAWLVPGPIAVDQSIDRTGRTAEEVLTAVRDTHELFLAAR